MIRGVTKSILEINASKSDYFEKAILILREDCGDISEKELRIMAELLIGGEPPRSLTRKRLKGFIIGAAAAVIGSAVTSLIFCIAAFV